MVLKHAASAIALVFMSSIAIAQQPPAVHVRGTIESKDHQILNVKSRDGETLKVKLADNAPVRAIVKASLGDVKPGSFVGITAMPQPDGTQKAAEIHIFPEAMRGTGEGHRPWDLMPNSTMTNATVATQVASNNGKTLVLKYKDGEKTFEVPRNVAVVTFGPATEADLKPGEKVFSAAAQKLPDGTILASNISVGRTGSNHRCDYVRSRHRHALSGALGAPATSVARDTDWHARCVWASVQEFLEGLKHPEVLGYFLWWRAA